MIRVVKVWPYRHALLHARNDIGCAHVPRGALAAMEQLIPRNMRDNHIVALFRDDQAFGTASEFYVWFHDCAAIVVDKWHAVLSNGDCGTINDFHVVE